MVVMVINIADLNDVGKEATKGQVKEDCIS